MADLTVTITESVILNNADQGGSHTLTVSGITEIFKRIVAVPVSGSGRITLIESTGDEISIVGSGRLIETTVEYCRITNLGSTTLNLQIARDDDSDVTDDEVAWFVLEAGKSFMVHKWDAGFSANAGDEDAFSGDSITNIRVINADGSTEGSLEFIVAST
jgi:hypothetical protein